MADESIPLRTVQIGVDMDPEVATYVGMLEGTVAALCISDAKNRALLELLTGDGWEAARVDYSGDALQSFAVQALVRQTNMPIAKAKILVAKRWAERNHPADYVVPQSISTEEFSSVAAQPNPPQNPQPMSDRLKAWKDRNTADANAIN